MNFYVQDPKSLGGERLSQPRGGSGPGPGVLLGAGKLYSRFTQGVLQEKSLWEGRKGPLLLLCLLEAAIQPLATFEKDKKEIRASLEQEESS